MKTTAEEKFLRSMEKIVDESRKKFTSSEFKRCMASTHRIAMGVISKHRRMIRLWDAMDKRMQKRAR